VRVIIAAAKRLLVVEHESGEGRILLDDRAPKCLAVDAVGRVWCGTRGHGVFVSTDGGLTWGEAGLEGRDVTAVAAGASGVVYAGTEPSAVFRSEDGESWRELEGLLELDSAETWSFPPRPETHHVRAIRVHPQDTDRIWVAIEAGALIRSRDGGRTWEDRVASGPIDTHTLATHPAAPGRVWSAAGDGWFESEDDGDSWQSPDQGLEDGYLWSVAVDRGDPKIVIVSAASGPAAAHSVRQAESRIYRREGSSAWVAVDSGLPEPRGTTAAELTPDPSSAGAFWAASNHGLFRSIDAGLSWHRIVFPWPQEFEEVRMDALAVVPSDSVAIASRTV
jgi:ligand-binding sensor domain-containing protein